jgi:hypothetical protein
MCFGGGADEANRIARQSRRDEVARQQRIKTGMQQIADAFGGFGEPFYQQQAQNYIDYATPQINRQAEDARKQLVYALSRTGNLASSAAAEKSADLEQDVNDQRVGIANTGLDRANQTRNQVESIRSGVVAELNATGDNEAAAQAAIRNATNLTTPQGYSPLGQMFQSFTTGLSAIGSNPGNGFSGFAGGRGLFSPRGAGSQRVVGG